jgi:UDP-N-acetylmuramyl pentapeptide phosphotransferase/UDP-N-acetylglucosamine-1-phosphate transferase
MQNINSIIIVNFFSLLIISTILLYLIIYKKNNFLFSLFKKKKSDMKMHSKTVAQNGGLVIILLFVIDLIINIIFFPEINKHFNILSINRFYIFFLSIILLTIISIIDYKLKIQPVIRLFFHFFVCYISLSLIEFPIIPINILPLKLQLLIVCIFWVYVINTTNFIDGIDGMLSINLLNLMLCVIITLLLVDKKDSEIFYFTLIILPLILSFLIFNLPKAKIFMGDTGSIPIGYIVGYVLILLLKEKEYFVFLIAFLYPLLDVSLTIIRKMINKINPWARLFDYFFLIPVLHGGQKHSFVLKKIISISLITIVSVFLINFYNYNYIFFLPIIFGLNIYLIYYFNKFRKKKLN